jgi:hypothetical protein
MDEWLFSFFLPHGIFVDDSGSLFTTDVGSHQVIKWRTHPNGLTR